VQQHRGSIAVQSSIGNGSTFIIELPLQPAALLDPPQEERSRTTPTTRQRSSAVDS